jgi:hypothetical protein
VAALTPPHQRIVSNGGSHDGRDDADLVWVSEADRGQAQAANMGLERATGEVCAWLNADDVFNPEPVNGAIQLFSERPAPDVRYGAFSSPTTPCACGAPTFQPPALRPLPVPGRLHPDTDLHLPPLDAIP